jgi:ElaB/YqjD/DUF883 family membrane-anchored ribosome-binding protein
MAKRPGELSKSRETEPISDPYAANDDTSLTLGEDGSYSASEASDLDTNIGDAPPETEHIKSQIEETRNQMGETIDAIQERLSFANISEQVSETVSNAIETAKDTAYEATIGKAVNFMKNFGDGVSHSTTFKAVKKNPLPLALIGIGTGLLVYQSMSKSSSRTGNGTSRRLYSGGATGDESSTFGSAKRTLSDATDKIGDTASSAYESVSNVAGSAYESVTGAVSSASTRASDVASRVYDRAGEYGTIAHEKYDEYLEENPLALGAVAIAVGAAVGLAIPSTNYEGRLMGDAREKLMERAQDAAGGLVDKAKQAASEVGQTIKEEAQTLAQ